MTEDEWLLQILELVPGPDSKGRRDFSSLVRQASQPGVKWFLGEVHAVGMSCARALAVLGASGELDALRERTDQHRDLDARGAILRHAVPLTDADPAREPAERFEDAWAWLKIPIATELWALMTMNWPHEPRRP